MATAVEKLLETHLLGEDAGRIEDHWQTMSRGGLSRGGAVLPTGAVDVVRPDVSHAGGITEVKKIATAAATHDAALAPHCPLGPVALGACL